MRGLYYIAAACVMSALVSTVAAASAANGSLQQIPHRTSAASNVSTAQPEYTQPRKAWEWYYERGESLYRSGKYAEAYEEFRKAGESRSDMDEIVRRDLEYRMAMSAARANKAGAEKLLKEYLERYPESAYVSYVNFELGNTHFDREEYTDALAAYLLVDPDKLTAPEKDEYYFKTGYSYFAIGHYDHVQQYMTKVSFKSPYYAHSQYCLGYTDYRQGDYASAKGYFMNIAGSEAYADVLPFYLIEIEFSEGNYHYVTENGPRVMNVTSAGRSHKMMLMMGESWFYTSSWKNAIDYLAEYEKSGGEMTRKVNYMIGYSYYMLQDWQASEIYLSRVPGPDDKLSQNASYHLGDVYLKLGDKQKAMRSFSIASSSGHDENITEDALFNYGKLQYELGGGYFNEAINVLTRYLDTYPTSPRVPRVKEYLAAAYYNSSNFDAAYEALSQMPNPDNNMKAALQKITYFRALEHIQAGDYAGASKLIDESLRYRYNAKYTALAGFWQGELLFREGKYNEAIKKFETYIRLSPKTEPENLMARYNTGYAYFNSGDWANAKEWLDNFLLEYRKKDSYVADAYNRMGDSEFASRNFWRAIEHYDRAIATGTDERNYALFQRAMVMTMVDRPERKIEILNDIIKKGEGPYVVDAEYELGRSYMAAMRYNDAAATLEKFIHNHPNSPKYASALLDLGLIYQNLNDNAKSLQYYKMVVESGKYSTEARAAMDGIRGLYVDMNDVNTYFDYARSVGVETDLGAVQRDSLAFVSAQRVYMSEDRTKAAAALAGYLNDYPSGAYVANALYYSGENALERGMKSEASGYFNRLSQMYANSFTERGMERLASLSMELKNYSLAAETYKKLGTTASTTEKRDEALAGWLKAVQTGGAGVSDIASIAGEVAAKAKDKQVVRMAKFARADALAKLGRNDEAVRLYADVSVSVSDDEGAESAYRVIENAYKLGDAAAAEKLIYAFADKNPSNHYWLGRSFLTLGDIYAAAGDTFQARATYQSIVDGYSDKNDGIIADAAERIKNLK